MLKKLSFLMIFVLVAVSLFSCTLNSKTQLKFTAFPEVEYLAGEMTKEEFFESVIVSVDGDDYTLTQMEVLGASIKGIELDKVGSYTLIVEYKGVVILFDYDVINAKAALVNGVEYEDLLEAFEAANEAENGVEIKLLKNAKVDANKITIASTANVTFDLNGYLLYCVSEFKSSNQLILNKGTLEIVGEGGSIVYMSKYPDLDRSKYPFPGYACNAIKNEGTLTVNGSIVIENQTPKGGASYAIDNYAGSSLTVNNGTIKQTGGDLAIRIFTSQEKDTNVTINGGSISGRRAIWIQLAGSNETIAPNVNLEINGGTLSGTQYCIYEYSYGNSHANVNVTINGGEFLGSISKFGASADGLHVNDVTITINDGSFEYDVINLKEDGSEEVVLVANK